MELNSQYFGTCDTCGAAVGSRYHSFSRNVERCQYGNPDTVSQVSKVSVVLDSVVMTQYCGSECASIGVYNQLTDRGISLSSVGIGPIEPCSKCERPMNLAQAHVAYELMDQTEIRQPWLLSVDPHDSETVARLCSVCDGALTHDFIDANSVFDHREDAVIADVAEQFSPEKC